MSYTPKNSSNISLTDLPDLLTIRGRPAQRRGPEVMGAGCSQRSVARAFNVTQTRVWQIANRRAWVHV
jgi:hypothetical protein